MNGPLSEVPGGFIGRVSMSRDPSGGLNFMMGSAGATGGSVATAATQVVAVAEMSGDAARQCRTVSELLTQLDLSELGGV